MLFLRSTILLIAACGAAFAADITGRWQGAIKMADGGQRDYEFALKPEGAKLTGTVDTPQGRFPILEGSITGEEIAVAADRGEGRRISFKGKFSESELRIEVPGRRGQEIIMRRVSNEPTPSPLPALSLPALRTLPPNGLAKTPPMGWNSWNKFRTGINDRLIREIADAMVSSGMQKAGYRFINIDDGWEGTRDAQGNIRTNDRFPDMKALADYVHSKGLKLGIYSSPGPRTCAGFEGSFNHEAQDARTFAGWGIDYIKYDWCEAARYYRNDQMRAAYQKMGEALHAAGRPIVYSLCQYGLENVQQWGALVSGNLWRTTYDIRDTWESMASIGFDKQPGLETAAGPGHWNDPDMLEIGNGGMTDDEYRTHMSLWSMLAAPLIAGNDLRSMTPAVRDILTNAEVIAVNQDSLGRQAKRVSKSGDLEVWARPLQGKAHAVALFNRGAQPAKVTARWSDAGITGERRVRDLWAHEGRGRSAKEFTAEVAPHGVVMLRVE